MLLDPGLLAKGDLPVAVVFFEEARYVEDFAVERLVFGAHYGGVSKAAAHWAHERPPGAGMKVV